MMKKYKLLLVGLLFISPGLVNAQFGRPNDFLDNYTFYKSYHPQKAVEYKDVDGTPYLNDMYMEGILYLKDTTAVKLPLRYNVFADQMEYSHEGNNYVVGNPQIINKVELGESVFVYLPFDPKPGYYELYESGKAFLVRKKVVLFKPAEGPKPIEGVATPARFVRETDILYLVNGSQLVRANNLNAVKKALSDQEPKITSFIKAEKIRNASRENLIKIIQYYNTL